MRARVNHYCVTVAGNHDRTLSAGAEPTWAQKAAAHWRDINSNRSFDTLHAAGPFVALITLLLTDADLGFVSNEDLPANQKFGPLGGSGTGSGIGSGVGSGRGSGVGGGGSTTVRLRVECTVSLIGFRSASRSARPPLLPAWLSPPGRRRPVRAHRPGDRSRRPATGAPGVGPSAAVPRRDPVPVRPSPGRARQPRRSRSPSGRRPRRRRERRCRDR